MHYLAMLNNSFKKFLAPDPEADDFRNLINFSLYADTSVVKFFYKDPFSICFRKVATNRQALGIRPT